MAQSPPGNALRRRERSPAKLDGRVVITHPEKVMFPDDGITKGDLADYYALVAPLMLPHLTGRPVTMERYPAGIGKKGFWQKGVEKGFPGVARARRGARRKTASSTIRSSPTSAR